ncbi:MAG: hypothetical protein V3U02_10410 [Calditrichia bacterium]
MKITKSIAKTFQKYNVLRKYFFIILMVIVGLPSALFAQEKQDTVKVSQEEKDKYNEIKKAAADEKLKKEIEENETGNDPRAFNDKWTPFYRHMELENGLIQKDMTGFGTIGFSDVVGVLYELPLARYRDLSDVSGLPAGVPTDAIGVGDMSLKFLIRPKALDFSYGEPGEMNKKTGSIIIGMDFVLPTATVPALAGNAFVFAPILAIVIDMPLYGFFAMLNLYYFDVFKLDSAPETSRYVGRWFYMQPLTPPGEWWGLFFLMPEFQPVYDFETKDFSLWIGVELGKILVPGQVAYVKPGWGIDNSSELDRKFTFEAGYRWFF